MTPSNPGYKPPPLPEALPLLTEKLLDRQDILQTLHICPCTLYTWRRTGVLPYIKIGHKIYYRQTDVEDMLRKRRQEGKH